MDLGAFVGLLLAGLWISESLDRGFARIAKAIRETDGPPRSDDGEG